jgi:hypothetical protein
MVPTVIAPTKPSARIAFTVCITSPPSLGLAIISASIHFRPASPTKCGSSIAGGYWGSEFKLGELFANPDGRISPHAPVPIPYRFSTRPIAIRRRGHIYRRRRVVAWAGDRGSDNSSRGEAAYEPSRNVPAACTHWRSRSTGERQRHRRWQKQKSCHVFHPWPEYPRPYGSSNF